MCCHDFLIDNIVFTRRIGERKVGDQLNLERAMGSHTRFGGHFVQV